MLFVYISVHPLSNRWDIFLYMYFYKSAPICKAPLYARMFGNLLYQHKKAFRLLIKYNFQWFYTLCVYFGSSTFKQAGYFLVLL